MNMKNFCLALFLLASVAMSSVFAAPSATPKMGGYFTSLHPKSFADAKHVAHPPTDITVINSSSSMFYVTIPNTSIYDALYPGNNEHIYNVYGAYYTDVVLRDPGHTVFFANVVCPLAIMTVTGYPGAYHVTVDSDLCN